MVKISSWSVKHIAVAREELLPPSSPTISPPWGWDKRGGGPGGGGRTRGMGRGTRGWGRRRGGGNVQ